MPVKNSAERYSILKKKNQNDGVVVIKSPFINNHLHNVKQYRVCVGLLDCGTAVMWIGIVHFLWYAMDFVIVNVVLLVTDCWSDFPLALKVTGQLFLIFILLSTVCALVAVWMEHLKLVIAHLVSLVISMLFSSSLVCILILLITNLTSATRQEENLLMGYMQRLMGNERDVDFFERRRYINNLFIGISISSLLKVLVSCWWIKVAVTYVRFLRNKPKTTAVMANNMMLEESQLAALPAYLLTPSPCPRRFRANLTTAMDFYTAHTPLPLRPKRSLSDAGAQSSKRKDTFQMDNLKLESSPERAQSVLLSTFRK